MPSGAGELQMAMVTGGAGWRPGEKTSHAGWGTYLTEDGRTLLQRTLTPNAETQTQFAPAG